DPAGKKRNGMGHLTTKSSRHRRQTQRVYGAHAIVDAEGVADDIARIIPRLCMFIAPSQTVDMGSHGREGEYPHAEHRKPAEELYEPQLTHGPGHFAKIPDDLSKTGLIPGRIRVPMIPYIFVRRILFGKKDGHENSDDKNGGTDVIGIFDIVRDAILARHLAET